MLLFNNVSLFVNISEKKIPVLISHLSGSTISLLCLKNDSSSSTSWIYSSTSIVAESNLTMIDRNSTSSQYVLNSDEMLTIFNITRNNEGYYACLDNINHTVYSSTYLFVKGY